MDLNHSFELKGATENLLYIYAGPDGDLLNSPPVISESTKVLYDVSLVKDRCMDVLLSAVLRRNPIHLKIDGLKGNLNKFATANLQSLSRYCHCQTSNVQGLYLQNLTLTNEFIDSLCGLLNPTLRKAMLQTLHLYRCSLTAADIRKLFDSLCGNVFMEIINLSGNQVGDKALPAISNALANYETRLRQLSLCNCQLGDPGKNDSTSISFSIHYYCFLSV
jgi:hypothetical protein